MNRIRFLIKFWIILALPTAGLVYSTVSAISSSVNTLGAILYAKPGGAGNCTSWVNACELQTALGMAVSNDQVWVAAGTYKPTTTNTRTIPFALKSGVAIYGGFPADGGDWNSRNWLTNITTLSGDIGVPGQNSDNSYHVVEANSVDAAAVLDGFTIISGNANGVDNEDDGGGMDDRDGNPTLRNLTFSNNYAVNGGGLYLQNSSSTVMNVTFSNNSAGAGGGLLIESSSATLMNLTFSNNSVTFGGGGLFITDSNSTLTLTDITFADNTSDYVGGGMVNNNSTPVLTNFTFSNNSADSYGGGLDNYESSPTLTNMTFSGNSAPTGGGLFNTEGSNPSLTNITFAGNSASDGGGMYNWYSNPILTNSILWGNTPNQITNGGSSTPVVTFSDVQGGYAGTGNINLAPLLDSLADNGGPTLTHALLEGSPAIDAGSPTICPPNDQRHYPRPFDGDHDEQAVCDMGSFEYGPNFFLHLPLVLR